MSVPDGVVVVTGEALIDLVLALDGSLDGHPGGGPYNVARTIGRLEQPVSYLGRVSTDGFGKRLRLELEADGVNLDSIVATDAPDDPGACRARRRGRRAVPVLRHRHVGARAHARSRRVRGS